MNRKSLLLALALLCLATLNAQEIPQNVGYSQVYSLIDELVGDQIIDMSTVVKPYSRVIIAQKLQEAQQKDSLLNKRQREEIKFYLNDLALECDTIPTNWVQWSDKKTFNLSLAQPSFHYLSPKKNFKLRITPILGMDLIVNRKGMLMNRWYGAELQATIVNHVSVWGSIRDQSYNGKLGLKDAYFHTDADKMYGARIAQPGFLNPLPGKQYKEANYGGDYSDVRAGISAYSWWGSIGIVKDNIQWGYSPVSSNIISGKAPSVPMITLNLRPVWWFEMNYYHAWLVSNVADSTAYYIEQTKTDQTVRQYRQANKFMAANLFTFRPVHHLDISFGNSIIYAERGVQAAYFLPIAFYKSLDHLLTKGTGTQNQNSQVFFLLSTRNLKHLHVYGSVYLDEFKFARLKKSNPQHNPVSYQVGLNLTNWPLKNLSLKAEFTRTNIACYSQSIPQLDYTSNSYLMGNYMGDNAQNIYAALEYKPVRGLFFRLSYTHDTKYNKFDYIRREIGNIISQKPFNEKIYQNQVVAFNAVYEIFNNCFAHIDVTWNNAQAFAPTSAGIDGEDRGYDVNGNLLTGDNMLSGEALQTYYLNKFCPVYYQGKNLTFTAGLTFSL